MAYTVRDLSNAQRFEYKDMKFLCIVLKIAFGVEKELIKLI